MARKREERKLSQEHRDKIAATVRLLKLPSGNALEPVSARLRPDQIEYLSLVNADNSSIIRIAVDLFLETIQIRQYTPEQAAAIADYEKIASEFPVGTIFVFNPQTLGGVFYRDRIATTIATSQQLMSLWNTLK